MASTSKTSRWFNKESKAVLLITAITLLAIILGLVVKSAAISQTRTLSRAGVVSEAPLGWIIRQGVAQEPLIYSASDPGDPYLKYAVSLLPAVPGGTLGDSVVTENLNRARSLNAYKVLDQTPVTARGKDAYRISFAYVQTNDPTSMPVVVRGLDFYFLEGDQVLLVTLEEQAGMFESALPGFMTFMESVKYTPGGVK